MVLFGAFVQIGMGIALFMCVERTWVMKIIYEDDETTSASVEFPDNVTVSYEYHEMYGPVCRACNVPIDVDGDLETGLCGLCMSAALSSGYEYMDD